ncbi:hypothetical protein SDC9_146704 [bioreactor metagenome]|uniref:Uncharacterized protein n=1 Tax=bioreactor metagenome TaxID=1076179 RepID=A0A645EFX1_9ZZZZ
MHQKEQQQSTQRGKAAVHGVDRSIGGGGSCRTPEGRSPDSVDDFFAFQIAVCGNAGQRDSAVGFAEGNADQRTDKEEHHDHIEHRALPAVFYRASKGDTQRGGNQQDREHLHNVTQRRRVFKWISRVCAEESAAVGAELFDCNLTCSRPHWQHLLCAGFECRNRMVCAKALHHALRYEKNRDDERQWQEHIERDSRQIDPETADRIALFADKPANQRIEHCNAGCRRDKVLHRQSQRLREVRKCRFTGVCLPVGIGDKAHRGVECKMPTGSGKTFRIQ